ncbi:MAG TPA: hypothetical protein VIS77_12185 [Burkholderiales bacterium]
MLRALFLSLLLAGCAALPAPPAGSLVFALLGDTPYSQPEVEQLDGLIDELNAAPLAFVVHVGDITTGRGPCTDVWFEARKRQFARIRAPFVLLPGDNDWTDCYRTGFDPLERLAKWRALFCDAPQGLAVERQSSLDARHAEYCEHLRWRAGDTLFIALNVQGSNNNLGRTPAMDAEHHRRMGAVFDWMDEAFRLAGSNGIGRLVFLIQANPGFAGAEDFARGLPDGFAGFREALAKGAAALGKPVVVVNGDTHTFRDDTPLPGVRRIEVWGAPFVRWLRAVIGPDGALAVETAP